MTPISPASLHSLSIFGKSVSQNSWFSVKRWRVYPEVRYPRLLMALVSPLHCQTLRPTSLQLTAARLPIATTRTMPTKPSTRQLRSIQVLSLVDSGSGCFAMKHLVSGRLEHQPVLILWSRDWSPPTTTNSNATSTSRVFHSASLKMRTMRNTWDGMLRVLPELCSRAENSIPGVALVFLLNSDLEDPWSALLISRSSLFQEVFIARICLSLRSHLRLQHLTFRKLPR